MSEIESLTRRIHDLNAAVDFWNAVMLWGLALAALAAVIIGLSTRLVVVRSSALGQTQVDLTNAKERELQSVLKSKDVEIANAQRGAAEANLKAASARLDALHSANLASIVRLNAEQSGNDRINFGGDDEPRTLSTTQKANLAKAVMPYGPFQNVDIFVFRGRETVNLAIDISKALPDWSVEFFWATTHRFRGVKIEYDRHNPIAGKQALALYQGLADAGLFVLKPTPTLPNEEHSTDLPVNGVTASGPIRITVGERLQPPAGAN